MDIILGLLALVFLVYLILLLSYSMFRGAPFAAISKERIDTMMKLLSPKKEKRFLDLGSGDGRIVIAASKKGLNAFGYEINPVLIYLSRRNIKKQKSKGKILFKDYWRESLTDFDYIAVWGVQSMMQRLEKKLLNELKPGSRVVSNHCKFPNWKYSKKSGDVYLYLKKDN